ncbi:MAG TPA: serine hydrolase domain-containing protein, partial [Nannocystis sp.]
PDLPILPAGEVYSRDQLMQAIAGLSLVRAPGVAYEYSNLGFALLGHLIAATTEKPFGAAIRDAILTPLGMHDTVWQPDETPAERLALGHVIVDGKVFIRPPGRHSALSAAGGLFSTVEDLARFVAYQLDAWPPHGGDDSGPLTRATLRESQRMQAYRSFRARTVPDEIAASGVDGGTSGVGFVWGVSHGCEHSHVVGHNGALDGYFATVRVLPQAGVGIIVLANAGWADTDHITARIQRVLADGGALARRAPQALPELTEAAARIVDLFPHWDEATFAAFTTHRLGAAGNAKRLGDRMRWLHAGLGACTLGELKRANSPWSGVFAANCEQGRADLIVTLTSASTPKISEVTLKWFDGTPSPAVQDAAVAAAALLEQFDPAQFRAVFSPAYNLAAMKRAVATLSFEHGACKLGRALEVEGPEKAIFLLQCERGNARMAVTVDRAQPPRIVELQLAPAGGAPVCR